METYIYPLYCRSADLCIRVPVSPAVIYSLYCPFKLHLLFWNKYRIDNRRMEWNARNCHPNGLTYSLVMICSTCGNPLPPPPLMACRYLLFHKLFKWEKPDERFGHSLPPMEPPDENRCIHQTTSWDFKLISSIYLYCCLQLETGRRGCDGG